MWAVLAIIGTTVALMLCCVACCAARCFRPENSKGTAWYPTTDGKETFVRGFFEPDDKRQGFVRVYEASGGAAGAAAGSAAADGAAAAPPAAS